MRWRKTLCGHANQDANGLLSELATAQAGGGIDLGSLENALRTA